MSSWFVRKPDAKKINGLKSSKIVQTPATKPGEWKAIHLPKVYPETLYKSFDPKRNKQQNRIVGSWERNSQTWFLAPYSLRTVRETEAAETQLKLQNNPLSIHSFLHSLHPARPQAKNTGKTETIFTFVHWFDGLDQSQTSI